MMKRFEAALRLIAALSLVTATAACTLMRPPASLPPGTSIADARQTLGAGDEYPLPNGGTRLSFPRGKDTYMLDFDASGHLVQSQQVLNLQTFATTALMPSNCVPLAAQSRLDPVPYSSPPNTIVGVPSAMYSIAAS